MLPTGNLLLDSLSAPLRTLILTNARPCELDLKTVLVRPGRAPLSLIFLTSGMASLVVTMMDGAASEVGMLGREGFTGSSTLIGPDLNHPECIVQIPGRGLQVSRQWLQSLFATSNEFQGKVLEVVQRQLNISAQLSACNLRHEAEGRFCRWLLMASDLIDSPTLLMTQEFLSEMLGTRRTTISAIVQPLRSSGLISVTRGTVRILDRAGLMAKACECYEICSRSMHPEMLKAMEPDRPMRRN
ncbi:Crp/Fnr family transcriptional regulator [Terriglobus roseus]|uniref:cAMP-binding domain of CRP or a regulatory subunit of cAMP-dependent protein kinases n=1 Tax=Terriglobus roseus TaxID=392734 RepID=A0A1H4MY61_9BACT|nr:Crp/Fnr family transcriptional regulator [Terriglobus roseus]SEB87976.1 cAMP-binding domain of CRP or a regulatory subunit of cAMP-dependent protein kinases [Terriglobus roseus]